ncbi:ROK family transcriptional regulator [Roseibium sp. TrichSKD4]|uniref:ROK family transcriptional regulator n=1 Tax=Roseibium sp. TrichSKD4 TaxID=744980 RepID=UPI00058EF7C7|nr:ROK family transcriptional regulator [Roseibium sp. TrichSKD4]
MLKIQLSSSERQVMNVVRANGPIPRSKIAELTSLTQQSVHRLVDGLVSKQFLQPREPIVSGRGKPSPRIALDEEALTSIGVSIRTGEVEVCACTIAGTLIATETLSVNPNDRSKVIKSVASTLHRWRTFGTMSGRPMVGIGVAVQGYRVNRFDQFTTPLPIECWSNVSVGEMFEKGTGLPAFTENDANCAALAELYCGIGRHFCSFVYLAINFGFGGGIIYDNELILGGFGNAGELSDIFLTDEMPNRPSLEGLIRRLREGGVNVETVSDIRRKFDPTWTAIGDWIDEASPLLNLTVRAIRAIVDPKAIVFGGEAPNAMREELIKNCIRNPANRYGEVPPFPALIVSEIDGDAATLGAATLPLRGLLY